MSPGSLGERVSPPGNRGLIHAVLLAFWLFTGPMGCASTVDSGPVGKRSYPFLGIRRVDSTATADEVRAAYPEVFRVVDDPSRTEDVDVRGLRRDLAHVPVDERNYRALRGVAIAFFGLHARAERDRGGGRYLTYSFQATKMVAIPWRLYDGIEDPDLRAAILDFYEDVMFGNKPGLERVRGRYTRMVSDLVSKETDGGLRARIETLVDRGRALTEGR